MSYCCTCTFYTRRNDACDCFAPPLEKCYPQAQVPKISSSAGLEDLQFSSGAPSSLCFWIHGQAAVPLIFLDAGVRKSLALL